MFEEKVGDGIETSTEQSPLVSIVFGTIGRPSHISKCLESIKKFTPIPYELVVVVANGHTETVEILRNTPFCKIIIEENPSGATAAFNKGFVESNGRFIVHLNDDVEVLDGWITNMLRAIGDQDTLGAFCFFDDAVPSLGFTVYGQNGKPYANFGCIRR